MGRALRAARILAGLTNAKAARESGVGVNTVTRCEAGHGTQESVAKLLAIYARHGVHVTVGETVVITKEGSCDV